MPNPKSTITFEKAPGVEIELPAWTEKYPEYWREPITLLGIEDTFDPRFSEFNFALIERLQQCKNSLHDEWDHILAPIFRARFEADL